MANQVLRESLQQKHTVYLMSQKKEIKENKETIIITEAIDVSQDEVSDMPGVIIKFIKSADKTMTEHNYYLSSTDTAGLIPYSRYTRTDTLVITLIFKKNN